LDVDGLPPVVVIFILSSDVGPCATIKKWSRGVKLFNWIAVAHPNLERDFIYFEI
jgi:hypothetical protein